MAPVRKIKDSKSTKETLMESNVAGNLVMNGSNGVSPKHKKSPASKRGRPSKTKADSGDKVETNGAHANAGKIETKKGRGKAEKTKETSQPSVKNESNGGISVEGKAKRGKIPVEPASSASSEKEGPVAKRGRPVTKKPETAASNLNGVHEEPTKSPLLLEVVTRSSEKKEQGEKRPKGKQKKPTSSKAGTPSKVAKLQDIEKTASNSKKTPQKPVAEIANGSKHGAEPEPADKHVAKRGRKPKAIDHASNGVVVEQKKQPSKSKPPGEQKKQEKSNKPKRDAKSIIQGSLNLSVDDSMESEDQEKSSGILQPTKRTTSDGRRFTLKLSTFNVSGLRSWFGKGGQKFLTDDERPDILFLQETKISSDKDITDEMRRIPGYHSYFQHSEKKGYAGVVLYSKIMPMTVTYGLNKPEHDEEGRVITAEYEKFYLVGAYVPNSSRGLTRLSYRQKWNDDFLAYLKRLDEKKPVIFCGDLNVAHQEIDLANPKTNKKNAGFTDEERGDFGKLLSSGFIDTFRKLYPKLTGAYTFWSNMRNAREKNVGWRLDYFVISERLEKDLCDCLIRKDVKGSDHCPVTLFMAL